MEVVLAPELDNLFRKWDFNLKKLYKKKHIIVHHSSEWDGGYNFDLDFEEVNRFFIDFKEMFQFITAYIQELATSQCIIGKYYNYYWLRNWRDVDGIELYRLLKSLLNAHGLRTNSKNGLKFTTNEYVYLIEKVIEANFRFLSDIGLFFPETGVVITPTHHFEFHIYSPDLTKHKEVLEGIAKAYKNIKVNEFVNPC